MTEKHVWRIAGSIRTQLAQHDIAADSREEAIEEYKQMMRDRPDVAEYETDDIEMDYVELTT